jgi:hypothetical protein
MLFIEIDVKPFTSSSTRLSRSDRNEPHADPLSSPTRTDDGVEDEGMNVTIPGHIDKPDQFPGITSNCPPETVCFDLACPIDLEDGMGECFCVQGVQFLVVKVTEPLDPQFSHESLSFYDLSGMGDELLDLQRLALGRVALQ